MNNEQVLQLVDQLCHEFASSYRSEARQRAVEKLTAHNNDYAKCAEKIMQNISDRRGFDLYSCDKEIIDDIRNSITTIISAHFA